MQLTVADINATNPSLWNSWRASLLRQLYTETKRALRRGLENPLDREEQIRQTQSAAIDILVRGGIDQDDAEQLWSQLGDDYFLRHTSADVALHTEAILQQPADGGPLVLIKDQPGGASVESLSGLIDGILDKIARGNDADRIRKLKADGFARLRVNGEVVSIDKNKKK